MIRRRAADLPGEGFRVATFPRGLAIVGRPADAKLAPGSKATLCGVYHVLERFLGIRWYFPGELGQVIPPADTLSIAPVSYTDHSRRAMRLMPSAPPQYRVANCSPIAMACHTPLTFGRQFDRDPECFEQRLDGSRDRGMPCYGNPRTVRMMIEQLDDFHTCGDATPWKHAGGSLWFPPSDAVYSISPPTRTSTATASTAGN